MAEATPRVRAVEQLADLLLDGDLADPLADDLVGWLASSARFRAFATTHRQKIRKKLRGAADPAARRDVRTELRVAHLLLADRRIDLAFEAYGSAVGGPDFTVAFLGERNLNLEVTRVRATQLHETRYAGPLLTKLRQLPASAPNAILLAVDDGGAAVVEVDAATRALRRRADAKDDAFFARRGFDGTRGFYQRYLRLGGIYVWAEAASGDARATLWTNRSARIAWPDRAARACVVCLRGT